MRQRKSFLAATVLVLVFAGCKGESPTAPSPTTPNTPGGGVTPPTGATVAITVSNATPLVDSTTVVTATVTQNGTPVANGTAVEFRTTLGTFTDANAQVTIRTTTNGVATATLTSSTAGTATITATVNNVAKTTTATFQLKAVTPTPPDLTPQITGVSPAAGKPQGNDVVTITGKNFVSPVKVIFDFGNGVTKEAFVISSTSTQIQVFTPSVDLGTGQQKTATIVVINNVGSPTEARVSATTTFTFQNEVLTPKINAISPASGPIDGGTRITIFGEGFQAPLQVFFGSAEAQVVAPITFSQIVVMSPTARDTSPNASETVTGPVDIRIVNINSATNATAAAAFRYIAKMVITAISPTFGSALGGTDVRIEGTGFNDPLTVDIGGVRATVLGAFGTHVIARTGRQSSPCTGGGGPVIVTNIDNGDTATSVLPQLFTYVAVNPVVNSVTSSATPITTGSPILVSVTNPGVGLLGDAQIGLTLGGTVIQPSPSTLTGSGTGVSTFSSAVPTNITFPSVACTVGGVTGTQLGPVTLPVVFTNLTTSCTATLLNAITVQPPTPNPCIVPPSASVTSPPNACPNLAPASVVAAGAATQTATITITNGANSATLTLAAPTITPNNATVTISPNTQRSVPAGGSQSYTVTVDPTAAGPDGANVSFGTNDPNNPTITVTVCGSAT